MSVRVEYEICPVCGGTLLWVNGVLACVKQSCGGKR